MSQLTTKDIRVNGYPPLDEILLLFDALPLLVQACKKHSPQVVKEVAARIKQPTVARNIQPITPRAVRVLEPRSELARHG